MKKCFTSPIIRKMQMQTTMRYHLTPVRIAVIKKTKKKKKQLIQSLWKTVWRFLKKLKIEIELPSNPVSGYISKGIEIGMLKRLLHSHVYCGKIHSS
jgi:hypothetical protein